MQSDIILISVRGKDTPGITAKLTGILAQDPHAKLLDIEQTVVHKKLILSILIGFTKKNHDRSPLLKDLLFAANPLGVELNFEVFDAQLLGEEESRHQYVITCLGDEIGAYPLSHIAKTLAAKQVNIDKISKLTLKHIKAVELLTHAKKPIDTKNFSKELLSLSSELGIDIALQQQGLLRRAKRLVVMDMDSTLVRSEVIDELGRQAGVLHKISAITERAMRGEMGFAQSLKTRVALLKGLKSKDLEKVYRRIRLNKGADRLVTVLKKLGYKIALVSGGVTYFTDRFKERLGLDYAFANELEIKNGSLTGKVTGPIVDSRRKAEILEMIAQGEKIALDQVIAIGDGANDIPMLIKAGLGVAFHAKPKVREKARCSVSHHASLDSILYLLGISEKEIRQLSLRGA